MRNGPQSISMFRLSSIALGFLAVTAFTQNAQASVIFVGTEGSFGPTVGTLDWGVHYPTVPSSVPNGSTRTVPLTGFSDTDVTFTRSGTIPFLRLTEGVNTAAGIFTNGTELLATNSASPGGVVFDFSNPIGGFGITLQEVTPGATSTTTIQAFGLGGTALDLAFAGSDVMLNGSGTGGTNAFLGIESSLNDIYSIVVATSSNNFIMNSPTFQMNSTATGVPEPGTWLMMGLGSLLYGVGKRRKKKNIIVEEAV